MTDLAPTSEATGEIPADSLQGIADAVDAPADQAAVAPAPPAVSGTGAADDRPVEWAPAEPQPKKRRTGLWIGIAAAVLALGAGAASAILIAPGTTIAGVHVGGMTAGAAADAVSSHVASMKIDVDGATISGADLGASVDAKALAEEAFAAFPLWNVTQWGQGSLDAPLVIDEEKAESALRDALPSAYTEPVNASTAFDAKSGTYKVSPAEEGTGIDLDRVTNAISGALSDGSSTLTLDTTPDPVAAPISEEKAAEFTESLNAMLAHVGYYVGDERTVAISPADAAKWLTVDADGAELSVQADAAAIQASVDTLRSFVHRAPVDAKAIVDSDGDVLETITEGVTGRELGDVSALGEEFASKLENLDGTLQVPATEAPFATETLLRTIDVNLSAQVVTVSENGTAVKSWPVSSGTTGFETTPGSFAINWKLSSQNMGNEDVTKAPYYFQPDVKWVMYFNGDEALHGVYWHSNWGTPMSHGCVGMPEDAAQWLYDWAPEGTEVNVHY